MAGAFYKGRTVEGEFRDYRGVIPKASALTVWRDTLRLAIGAVMPFSNARYHGVETMDSQPIPCPFVYARGKRCSGHIVRVEAYKADLEWTSGADGAWSLELGALRSHHHLCFVTKK